MRLSVVYVRGMKEQIRDILNFILTIFVTPVFIVLYYFMTSGGSTVSSIALINYDAREESTSVTRGIIDLKREDGTPIMKVFTGVTEEAAEKMMIDRKIVLAVIIPGDFSDAVSNNGETATVILRGDPSHPYYMTCAAMIWNYLESYQTGKGIKSSGPIIIEERFAGTALVKTEFENYIPGLIVISVIMLVFIAAVNVARDRQDGLFLRYRLTSSPAWVYLTGNLLVFLTMAVLAIVFSLLTAALLGFRFNGTWPLVVLILIISVFPVLALGILCGVFVRSAIQAYLIASFPFLFLMFFSGSVFPLPETILFTFGDLSVRVFDFIPTSHAVRAMTKVLIYEQGFGQILGELVAMAVLSVMLYVPTLMLIRNKLKSEM